MTVRDLLQQQIDVDVYDSVCDDIGVAFCGPAVIRPEGQKFFKDVLDLPVEINKDCAIVKIDWDNAPDEVWEHRLKRARYFFWAIAGYVSCEKYDRWFEI